jgi:hypothetical protein
MDMLAPDLTVQVSPRRWSCVLDPTLALSRYGVPLACGLGRVMEVWMVPEFWRILDNTFFYLRRPELLLPACSRPADQAVAVPQETTRALLQWEKLRGETDFVRRSLNWVGDAPPESSLPEGINLDLLFRWERLAQTLEARSGGQKWVDEPLHAASRDAAALSVALPASAILTMRTAPEQSGDARPAICDILERFGLACRPPRALDDIVALERDIWRQLLVRAGLAKYLWAGLELAVLHLVAPGTAIVTQCAAAPNALDETTLDDEQSEPDERDETDAGDLWESAHGFWYQL